MNPIDPTNAAETARAVKSAPVTSPGSVRRSTSFTQFAVAMAKVQSEIEDPTKNKKADAGVRGSYRYADLPTVLDVVRPALSRNGFAFMQLPCELDGQPALTTLLVHASGDWLETTVYLRAVKYDPQGIGSALTYARRYAILAVCGIAADDDDDGKAACQPAKSQPAAQQPQAVSDSAKEIAAAFDAAKSRADGVVPSKRYGDALDAGHVSDADKAFIEAAGKRFGTRFPAPAKA